jgi:phenylpropionate dioxygenase-like ring-hydroxylating dioxygenase large terminal subunit
MKQAIFDPEWYTDNVYFKKEWDNLFSKVWIHAGFTARVADEGSYFTIRLFDKEVVIHRLQGEVKAYLNVCPHRGGPLVLTKDGQGAPVCKYHGWAFRAGDVLTGFTNAEWFNSDSSPSACGRQLQFLLVKIVGEVIFVSFSETPIPLEEQYSQEVLDALERLGQISDFAVSSFNCPINWKLNVENVKDFLHPYYVHPDSFKPLLSYEEKAPTRTDAGVSSELGEFGASPALRDLSFINNGDYKNPTRWWRNKVRVTQPENVFRNIFLFPNTNLFSVAGSYYVSQQYFPTSVEDFDYVLTVALPEKLEKFDTTVLLTTLIHAERAVIYEDEKVLKKVHQNMRAGLKGSHFSHGDYEVAVMNQLSYLQREVY